MDEDPGISVNNPLDLANYTTDGLPEGSTNEYSKWDETGVLLTPINSSVRQLNITPSDYTMSSSGDSYNTILWDNTVTLDYAGGSAPAAVDYGATIEANQSVNGFGMGILFWGRPILKNVSGVSADLAGFHSFVAQPTWRADNASISAGFDIGMLASGNFDTINGGTLTATSFSAFFAGGITVGSGATVTNYYGVSLAQNAVTGTITNAALIGITPSTAGTNNTALLMGTQASGNWNIYQSGTVANRFGGVLQIPNGTASAPGLSFASDTDLGLYRIGSNRIGISTGNSLQVDINSTRALFANAVEIDGDLNHDGTNVGLYGVSPVARATTGIAEASFTENAGGTAINVDSTFGGYTVQQIAQALQDIGILT